MYVHNYNNNMRIYPQVVCFSVQHYTVRFAGDGQSDIFTI